MWRTFFEEIQKSYFYYSLQILKPMGIVAFCWFPNSSLGTINWKLLLPLCSYNVAWANFHGQGVTNPMWWKFRGNSSFANMQQIRQSLNPGIIYIYYLFTFHARYKYFSHGFNSCTPQFPVRICSQGAADARRKGRRRTFPVLRAPDKAADAVPCEQIPWY